MVEQVRGRAPVLAGVGFNAHLAADLAREAEAAGADAVMVLPHAYGAAEPDGFYDYYRFVAQAVRIGVLLYARDEARVTPAALERLAELPNIVGYEDGLGDLRLWNRLRARLGKRLVLICGTGDDLVPAYFAEGAVAFTSSHANYRPEDATELFRLASGGDLAEAAALVERRIQPIYELRSRRRGYEVAVTKAAMDEVGRRGGPVRPPLVEITAAERTELRAILAQTAAAARADVTPLQPLEAGAS